MNRVIAAIVAASILLGGIENAEAKSYREDRAASRPHKPKSDLVIVKCKTKACLKKHPSGVYAFKPKQKKT